MTGKAFKLCVMAILFGGCVRHPADDASLELWRSPHSSLAQRAEAVSKLIPKGTSSEEVERVLGVPSRRARRHGPTLSSKVHGGIETERQETNLDEWLLEYEFSKGETVCLRFRIPPSGSNTKVWPLVGVSTFRTNATIAIPLEQ